MTDRLEARLECVRIAARQCVGEKLVETARALIALVEAPDQTIVGETELATAPMGADFLAGDADRRSIQKDPDARAAPPEVSVPAVAPGVSTAKDPEGGEDAPAPDGAARDAPAGGRDCSAPASGRPPTPVARASERDLTPALAGTLAKLREMDKGEGVRAADLAGTLGLAKATVLSRLKQMRKRGLTVLRGATTAARWFAAEAETSTEPGTDHEPELGTDHEPAPAPEPEPVAAPDPSQRKRRRCLRCDRNFMSDGPGNRICPVCAPNVRNNTGGLDDALGVVT